MTYGWQVDVHRFLDIEVEVDEEGEDNEGEDKGEDEEISTAFSE